MTQMLLFDAPASSPSFPVASSETAPAASGLSEVPAQESGLHHMGDLARLVLLRYELMAKRRARAGARRQLAVAN